MKNLFVRITTDDLIMKYSISRTARDISVIPLTNYFMSDEIKVPNSNSDNIENAVKGLDVFCHNFCMDCEETEKENDLVFRCDECCFKMADGRCLVKIFKNTFLPEYKNFGCMGDR